MVKGYVLYFICRTLNLSNILCSRSINIPHGDMCSALHISVCLLLVQLAVGETKLREGGERKQKKREGLKII